MLVIGIVGFLFVLCGIILYSRIKVVSSITLNQEKQTIRITCYFYRIRLLERSIDLTEETDQTLSFQETSSLLHKASRDFVQKIKDFHQAATLILERLQVHEIAWKTDVGTGQAHTTGMAAGGIWSTKGAVLGVLSAKSHLHCKPSIVVTPLYNQKWIGSTFDCMISIRAGQAIYALLKIIRIFSVKREAII
ncbi:DUF2953 domain-containing protein [Lentibacillus salicampi]|uniref:DUF2953 domain-containing protein n=1 Tax=Lentibacillus salicampi TaxID=175306 RepID=A0A4Y9ADU0_9BACI|nr:DUF2953 domain-containing protein [Lentibacillus salicampi]TFJ92551.1 DUF2953 domain-containing protein [Lentibacillus salicampi]